LTLAETFKVFLFLFYPFCKTRDRDREGKVQSRTMSSLSRKEVAHALRIHVYIIVAQQYFFSYATLFRLERDTLSGWVAVSPLQEGDRGNQRVGYQHLINKKTSSQSASLLTEDSLSVFLLRVPPSLCGLVAFCGANLHIPLFDALHLVLAYQRYHTSDQIEKNIYIILETRKDRDHGLLEMPEKATEDRTCHSWRKAKE
jgi:hypothetical protein